MAHSTARAINRRNVLLLAAAASFALSIGLGYRPWHALASMAEAFVMILIVGSGLFAAMGIREFAGLIFDADDKPWYAQRNAMPFLLAMSAAILLLYRLAFYAFPQIRGLPSGALLMAAMAAQLAWVAILDWPRPPRRDHADHETRRPASIEKPKHYMTTPSGPFSTATRKTRIRPKAKRKQCKKRRSRQRSQVNRRNDRLTR